MSKRDTHLFDFTGKQIAEAARSEATYHKGRLDWWQVESDKALAAAKENGFQHRSYDVTGGKRHELVLDPALQFRVNETRAAIQRHKHLADSFSMEASAYGTKPEHTFQLDAEDILHFRLAGGEREP